MASTQTSPNYNLTTHYTLILRLLTVLPLPYTLILRLRNQNETMKGRFLQRSVGPAYDPADDNLLVSWIAVPNRETYQRVIIAAVECWTDWSNFLQHDDRPSKAEVGSVYGMLYGAVLTC